MLPRLHTTSSLIKTPSLFPPSSRIPFGDLPCRLKEQLTTFLMFSVPKSIFPTEASERGSVCEEVVECVCSHDCYIAPLRKTKNNNNI